MDNGFKFEAEYKRLVLKVSQKPSRQCRNGVTRQVFGTTLTFDISDGTLPVLTCRQIYTKGILGEYAAMIRGPKCIEDFKMWGCNYWDMWADQAGNINVDYGNKWLNFGGVNQVEQLITGLKEDPYSRRHIISGWDPSTQGAVDLPCCHLLYQFNVQDGYLDMIWYQRSADLMVGVPSDALFAAIMLIDIAAKSGLKPRKVLMVFGDTHIYEEHLDNVKEYLFRNSYKAPKYTLHTQSLREQEFQPGHIVIHNYNHRKPIKFELKV